MGKLTDSLVAQAMFELDQRAHEDEIQARLQSARDAALEEPRFYRSPGDEALHQPEGRAAVAGRSWARSGARSSTKSGVSRTRPPGSWDAALDRARREWDGLAAPPLIAGRYSDAATAAILALAVALWPDVAASMAQDDEPGV